MKPFLITVGTVFSLIVVAHIARIAAEPQMAKEAWFWLVTLAALVLGLWAWRLVYASRAPRDSGRAN